MAYEFKLPEIGEGVVEGEIVSWKVEVGDTVAVDHPLVEVMTDKATVEIPSPEAGVVMELRGAEGDAVSVGEVILVLAQEGASAPAPEPAAAPAPEPEPAPAAAEPAPQPEAPRAPRRERKASDAKVLATPATRAAARELDVDLGQVTGTGPRGRITKADVLAWAEGRKAPAAEAAPSSSLPFDHLPVPPGSGPEERVKLIGLRRKIAESMVRSSMTIPHFSYVDEVDLTELVTLRKRVNDKLVARGGQKLSYLPYIMKACWIAFGDHPEVNALYDNTTGEVVYKKYFNCGLATDTGQGLYVSVIRDVPERSVVELGQQIREVTARVRAGKARREDLTDSTFTITSIGNIGGLFATPIINYPEVAILGVNKIVPRPMVVDGEIQVRQMMHLSPSFDHRIVDGANAARFVSRVKELLETPGLLLATL